MGYRNREEEKLERREESARRDQQGSEPGERPKKSWREVDAQRDGARRRSGGDGGGGRERDGRDGRNRDGPHGKGESPAYRAYKSRLDRLFESGKAPSAPVVEVVSKGETAKSAAPTAAPSAATSAEPLTPKEQLRAATTPEQILAAAGACNAAGGLPMDGELLLKVLGLQDPDLLCLALEAVLDLLEKGRPKNAKAIVARVIEVQPLLSDAHAKDIATGIRARLGG